MSAGYNNQGMAAYNPYTSPRQSNQPQRQSIRINVYPSQRTPTTLEVPVLTNMSPRPTGNYTSPMLPTAHYIDMSTQPPIDHGQSTMAQYQAAYNPQLPMTVPMKRLSTAPPHTRKIPAGKRHRSWSPYARPLNPEPSVDQLLIGNEENPERLDRVPRLVRKRVKKKRNRVSPLPPSGRLPAASPQRQVDPQSPLPYAEAAMCMNPDPLPKMQRYVALNPDLHRSPQYIDVHVTDPEGTVRTEVPEAYYETADGGMIYCYKYPDLQRQSTPYYPDPDLQRQSTPYYPASPQPNYLQVQQRMSTSPTMHSGGSRLPSDATAYRMQLRTSEDMRRPTRQSSTQTKKLRRRDTKRHRHSSRKTHSRGSRKSKRSKKNRVHPVSYIVTPVMGSPPEVDAIPDAQQPSSRIPNSLWPRTYITVALISILFMPLTGIFAAYSAIMTRRAIKRGHFALAVERSHNTQTIIIYSFTMGVVALVSVAAVASVQWVLDTT